MKVNSDKPKNIFWDTYDKHAQDAGIEITNSVAPMVIVDYVRSMRPVYEII